MMKKLCSLDGCERTHNAKELCKYHYDKTFNRQSRIDWKKNNPEKMSQYRMNWVKNNPEKVSQYHLKWQKNNPEKLSQYSMRHYTRRKEQLSMATPEWVNNNELEKIYEHCPEGYEVDHIIPLLSKRVCGLHVPWNLQYLTIDDNRKKGNRYEGQPR